MSTGEIVITIIVYLLSGILLFLGIRQFMEKGFLLNNAWLYATKEQRKSMDKKPYYRQSAIVFCILSAVFIVAGLSLMLQNDRFLLFEIPLISGAIIYAIVSSIRINKHLQTDPPAMLSWMKPVHPYYWKWHSKCAHFPNCPLLP